MAERLTVARPYAKAAYRINRPQDIGIGIARAIRAASSGRPGGVYLDLTAEVLGSALDVATMGALSRLPWWRRPGRRERAAAHEALDRVGLADLAKETFGELSDMLPSKSGGDKATKRWKGQVEKYEKQLEEIRDEAKAATKEGSESQKEAQKHLHESHVAHRRAEFFDFGELGLQFGVVLCSLAILTKGRAFWYVGLAASLAGLVVAVSGFFVGGHH